MNKIPVWCGLLFLLVSCVSGAGSKLGLVSRTVSGEVTALPGTKSLKPEDILILACGKARSWVVFREGAVPYEQCRYVPNRGTEFIAKFMSNESEMSLFFIAKGFRSEVKLFRVSIGVSGYDYSPVLMPSGDNWLSEYQLSIKPRLNSILSQNPLISQSDKELISGKMNHYENP